jgi:YHS domain-containing protein
MDKCPVCGMEVDRNNPAATSNYNGQYYNFCCEECKEKFDQNPQTYAKKAA